MTVRLTETAIQAAIEASGKSGKRLTYPMRPAGATASVDAIGRAGLGPGVP